MDQTTSVTTSARPARRTSAKAPLRTAVKPHGPKKVRRNGMVASTILFDPEMDRQLSALAFAWETDRSVLARQFVSDRLARYDIPEELRKAAARFAGPAPAKSAADEDRSGQGAGESRESDDDRVEG